MAGRGWCSDHRLEGTGPAELSREIRQLRLKRIMMAPWFSDAPAAQLHTQKCVLSCLPSHLTRAGSSTGLVGLAFAWPLWCPCLEGPLPSFTDSGSYVCGHREQAGHSPCAQGLLFWRS